mmetsp:Transcript_5193/g.8194  ORF Transcript_5193/g.8194 Transcript_5193/m.8194 type:complete len:1164 (+) Transcript_5193:40-3531(+)
MPGLEDDNKELLLGVQEGLEDDHKELLLGIQEEDTESPVETVRSYSQTRLGMLGRTFSTHNLFGALDEWSRGVRIPETPSEHLENSTRIKAEILRAETKKLNFVDDRAHIDLHLLAGELKVDLGKGLSSEQARNLLREYGRNELESDPPTPIWKLFLDQFNDILVLLLIAACIISMALGQYAAGTTIVIIVMFNAILGAIQEHGAGAALDALKALQVTNAKVIRDGVEQTIEGTDVVPGDLTLLQTGDSAVGDIRLIEVQDLEANEASLTGESEPVRKIVYQNYADLKDTEITHSSSADANSKSGNDEEKLTLTNVVYMGTEITNGRGRGIVIHTGMGTKIGHLAEKLKSVDSGQSPLKAKLALLGMRLGMASVFISAVIFVIGVSTGRGADKTSSDPIWLQMLLVAVSLTVAAVPEGLPVCVTMSLAIGMRHMTEKKALVRKLASVETLGSTSIICTDKTGTLTCGKMTTVQLWHFGQAYRVTGQGYSPDGIIYPIGEDSWDGEEEKNAIAFEQVKQERKLHPILTAFVLCSDATVELEEVDTETDRGEEDTRREWVGAGNMTERALVVAARKLGIERKALLTSYKESLQNPFSSKRKMMSVVVERLDEAKEPISNPDSTSAVPGVTGGAFSMISADSKFIAITKGAPNRVIERCSHALVDGDVVVMTDEAKKQAIGQVNRLSSQALRVLAVGIRGYEQLLEDMSFEVVERDLIFLGLNASMDPERPEVIPAIARASHAGVDTVMITGDYLATAKAIAENIGLLVKGADNSKRVIDCKELRSLGANITKVSEMMEGKLKNTREERVTTISTFEKKRLQDQLQKLYAHVDEITARTKVYARAEPFDKITIVESYKRQGHVVCMTGDGVNDAAALQGANIGVAMGSGTEVAKGAADMVLLDDSFATIVAAIEEGRKIYSNITKFVFFLLSTNVAEVLVILIAMLAGMQSPLSPIQILWLNLCTDGAPAVALALEHAEPGIMDEGPRPLSEPVLDKVQLTGIAIQTIVQTSLCLYIYVQGLLWHTGVWNGQNPDNTDKENTDGIRKAQTMVIYLIVFLELLRAYTSRALRTSLFSMGVFSNKNVQYAVLFSIIFTLLVGNVPGLKEAFDMRSLEVREWGLVLGLTPICAIVDELTKCVYRTSGFGQRPKAVNMNVGYVPMLRETA